MAELIRFRISADSANMKTTRLVQHTRAHFLVFALSLGLVFAGSASRAAENKLAIVLQPFVDNQIIAGAVLLVADAEKILDVETVGWSDIAAKKVMPSDSVFWIASMTKPITCTALMMLVDEGKVNVDAPVANYLPDFKDQMVIAKRDAEHMLLKKPARPMLVRDLMSHTSGITRKPMPGTLLGEELPLATQVSAYAAQPLEAEPGSTYLYSNAGINTAGRIVERASGMPFAEFLQKRLFDPLGMTDTTFWPSEAQIARLATAYRPTEDKSGLEPNPLDRSRLPLSDRQRMPHPGGGLYSTAADLAKFCQMILNQGTLGGRKYLSPERVKQMTSRQIAPSMAESYGFGWNTGGGRIAHNGAWKTSMAITPEAGLITILLVQNAGWRSNEEGGKVEPAFRTAAVEKFGKVPAPAQANAAATPSVQGRTITNSIGMKLVRIEPGSFVMGQDGPAADYDVKKHAAKFDDADWDEKPAHRVTISAPFSIGATEVTLAQYRQFDSKHGGKGVDDEAATGVNWDDAVKFCAWLSAKEGKSYRLPTEAEWEFACRAGTTTLFHTGDTLPTGFHQWPADIGLRERFFPEGKLSPEIRAPQGKGVSLRVAQTPANAWGLFDTHCNVAEWCADWYGPYEASEQTDPLGRSEGDFRVFRGGSHSIQTRLLRSANRSAWLPEAGDDKIGFRVVLGESPRGKMLPPATAALNAQNVAQSLAKIEIPQQDVPFFDGPKPFVKIPPDSYGPLFSRHNHSPGIAECPNGDLLAVWYSCVDEAGTELNNLASRLRRGATEWEPASLFWDGADVNDHGPKVWWDGERTLFHFARGLSENIVRTSTDNGATWSKARLTQPVSEFSNAPIKTREGFLVIMQDTASVSLNISRDGGQTWTFPVIAEKANAHRNGSGFRHIGIHSPVVQLADGRLMAVSRLDDAKQQEKFGFRTPANFSSDWGATWTYDTVPFPAISSVQRQVLMRLREGPLLFCSFTDQSRDWKQRKGLPFKAADGTEFTGYGLFAAVSFDEGKTWPVRRLITPGGKDHTVNGIDRGQFTLSDTMAEPQGYLAATQTRDGHVQLITSKNHYVFNLAWLKQLPPAR